MIELEPVAAYHGPSPMADDPVVVVALRVAPGDQAVVAQAIPALQSATADWYRMIDPSHDGSVPLPAVGDFLADWARQALTYVGGYLDAAGCVPDPDPDSGRALVWVGFHDPQLSLAALELGTKWLTALAGVGPDGEDHQAELNRLWARCQRRHPDYQARIVMEGAKARDVPYAPAWGPERFWRFGQGERSRVLFESSSTDDSWIGSWTSQYKSRTKFMLRSLGLPTPAFRLVESEPDLDEAVAAVGFPCVTKPLDRSGGAGVTSGLTDIAAVRDGYAAARACTTGPVMVEAHVEGDDHRLMVIDGRLAVAVRREPPTVTGDGRRTIGELVAAKNVGRDSRSLVHSGYLRPIALDASARVHLAGLGLSPDTVLPPGRTVRVRSNSNLTTGGDAVDVTAQVHPDLALLTETIARTLNLSMLGADFLTTDITRSPAECGGQFNEINITPGLEAMTAAGWPADRAGVLALGDTPGRIPLQLIIVADEALPTTLAAVRRQPWTTGSGWACWEQAANSGVELTIEAGPAWPAVQALLGHRTLSRAVILATDRQIYEYGVPQDHFDIAHLACDLNPMWLAVLQRCCGEVVSHRPGDSGAALAAVLASFG